MPYWEPVATFDVKPYVVALVDVGLCALFGSKHVHPPASGQLPLYHLLPHVLLPHACICDTLVCREKLRQLDIPAKLNSKSKDTFLGSTVPSNSRSSTSSGGGHSKLSQASVDEVSMAINQDLVAAVVKLEGMNRRLEIVEREKERMSASLADAQVGDHSYKLSAWYL